MKSAFAGAGWYSPSLRVRLLLAGLLVQTVMLALLIVNGIKVMDEKLAERTRAHLDEQKQFMTDAVRVAQETGMHLHIVCHARKPAGGTEDKPPTKYDLRGSAAVSDQAANVVTVWANKAKKEALEQNPHDVVRLAEPDAVVSVVKQRNDGWEGKVALWFHEPSLRFCDNRTSAVYPYAFMEEGAERR